MAAQSSLTLFILLSVAAVSGCAPTTPTPLEQAQELFLRKEYDKAIEHCTLAMDSDPANVQLLILRGQIYQENGKLSKALADFTQAIETAPSDPEAYYHRAKAYQHLGDENSYMADMRRAHQLDVAYQLAYQNQTTTPVVVDLPRSTAERGNADERQVADVAPDNSTAAGDLERRIAGSDDVETWQSSDDLATQSWTRSVPSPRPASQSFGTALAHPESKTANNNGSSSKSRTSLFDRWLESVKQSPAQSGTEDGLDKAADAELLSDREEETVPELGDDDKNPRRRVHGWNYDLSGSPLIRLRDHPAATGIQSNNPDNDEEILVPRGRFGLQQGSFFTGRARLSPPEELADVVPAPRIPTTGIRNSTNGLDLSRPGVSPVPRVLPPLDLRRPAATYLPPLRRPTTGISTSP